MSRHSRAEPRKVRDEAARRGDERAGEAPALRLHGVAGNVLELEHVTVRLRGAEVVRDLSWRVAKGASVAVIGPNGSGKTVLFKALIGALPYEGVIRWAPGTRIGYVPQKLDLERDLPITGGDLLRARARLAAAPRDAMERALARVDMGADALRKPVGTLSGGQFQRLLVAFALLADPTVLLLDEPTSGVDEPGQAQLNETVRGLREEQEVTVLQISHDLSVVFRYATEVLCMSRDHRCFGMPPQVLTPDVLAEVYGQPVGIYVHDDGHD